jgi:hypothetical protein
MSAEGSAALPDQILVPRDDLIEAAMGALTAYYEHSEFEVPPPESELRYIVGGMLLRLRLAGTDGA